MIKIAMLAIPMMVLSACGSHKKVAEETTSKVVLPANQKDFMVRVNENRQTSKYITSKLKFSVELGPQHVTLTGNLRMKRDEVIRLQLMAFGFVEAARIEFTKDYVLIMDRINKQYMKAVYAEIDFLRNSGINFYTLQALFWDELFMPNRATITNDDLQKYIVSLGGDDAVVAYESGKMNYSWLVGEKDATIKMANIIYKGSDGNTQLNWDYQDYEQLSYNNPRLVPTEQSVTLTTTQKEVKMRMKLSYLEQESEWESFTEVSNKYREVTIDEIVKRFMSL
jgi:hypothetical protein